MKPNVSVKNQFMLKVGITGGIGSGKTTICKIFETLGIPVYYADDRAKALMTKDTLLKTEIKKIFGKEAYFRNGRLNRKYLASIVFANPNKLKQLNEAVHPAVFRDSLNWHNQQTAFYTLKEAALLFESGSYKMLDKIITVIAPQELRIDRVIKRDKTSRDAVITRINKQWPDKEKINKSDFIIHNDGKKSLISQVLHIHNALINLGKIK